MVIVCNKCQTRFHVDDARVPDAGIKVRCSRCKHAFFVRKPDSTPEEVVDAAAEAALDSSAPEPSLDLAGSTEPPSPEAEQRARGEDEDDWQFAVEPPPAAAERTPAEKADAKAKAEASARRAPAPDALADRAKELRASTRLAEPESSSLADLANPESWDLVGAGGAPAATPSPDAALDREAFAMDASEAATSEEPAWAEEALPETGLDEVDAPAPAALAAPGRSPRPRFDAPPRVAAALRAVAWLALLCLLGAIGFNLARVAPAGQSASATLPVAGLEAREVRVRVLENASAGPLWLVTGSLVNPRAEGFMPEGAVRVVMLGEGETRLEASTLVGLPVEPARLRVEDPDRLRAELADSAARLARRRLRGGEVIPFQAILPDVAGAVAFRLERSEPPALAPRPRDASAGSDAAPSEPASAVPEAPAA